MFPESVLQEPVASKQREGAKTAVNTAIRNQTFTLTDVLMAPEPLRTFAFEHLDGLVSPNGISQSSGGDPIDSGSVRLVCVNKQDTIKVSVWGTSNIFGTNIEGPKVKINKNLGNDALVEDKFPTRLARNILRRQGWPARNLTSRGANEGTVVEWRWLERQAQSADAPPELVAIYEEIKARSPSPVEDKPTKNAKGQVPLTAHP